MLFQSDQSLQDNPFLHVATKRATTMAPGHAAPPFAFAPVRPARLPLSLRPSTTRPAFPNPRPGLVRLRVWIPTSPSPLPGFPEASEYAFPSPASLPAQSFPTLATGRFPAHFPAGPRLSASEC